MTVPAETEEQARDVPEDEEQVEQYHEQGALLNVDMYLDEQLSPPFEFVFDEKFDVDDENELPELTPEMQAAVEKALDPTLPPLEKLCSLNRLVIHRQDMDTLQELSWVNDEVINYYFELIVERSKNADLPSVYAFNSFFYTRLKTGYSAVRKWTRKVDIFAYDLILVPLHLVMHWCLAVVDNRSKTIRYYDSFIGGEEECLELMRNYLSEEMKDKKDKFMDPLTYSVETFKDIPLQVNGSDCGVFVLKYAEYISRDVVIQFNQRNTQYFRKKMVYELLTNQLL